MPETGTTSQTVIHVEPGGGEVVGVMGEGLTVLLSTQITQPELLLVEIVSPPGGGPPALHTHPPMEVFYILEGRVEFSHGGPSDRETFIAGPGSVVYIPGGLPHNYKNVGDTDARMLGIFTSSSMENFFRDMARASHDEQGAPVIPPDFAKLLAVMAQYDVAFVEQPGQG